MKPVADLWYSIEAFENNILLLRETHIDPYAVGDIWIVRGRDRDLVVDTGSGKVNPAPLVEAIAARPVTAIVLNASYDHAGGWHNFPDRLCHPLDAATLETFDVESAEVFDYLNDATLKALPVEGYQLSDYSLTQASPTRTVDEGDVIDLGDRSLRVMHVPGRSPGGIALWEESSGCLFTSDMLYDGDHGLAWPPADAAVYCASLRRFRALPVKRVYPGHYGTFDRERMLEVIDAEIALLEQD
ncbi:MAG: MBL fold metallo-hydrolase [Gammaproteobacteria bacterium]|nr:MBL fold metallo-hydrolase [Gammaproteobacteria bacterium]